MLTAAFLCPACENGSAWRSCGHAKGPGAQVKEACTRPKSFSLLLPFRRSLTLRSPHFVAASVRARVRLGLLCHTQLGTGACVAPTRCARLGPRPFRCTWLNAFEKRLAFTRLSGCRATAKWWRCVLKQARALRPGSATHGSADALRAASTEADGGLRAELLRYVQRKLFAEDACSQAAGELCMSLISSRASARCFCRCNRCRGRRAAAAQPYAAAGTGALRRRCTGTSISALRRRWPRRANESGAGPSIRCRATAPHKKTRWRLLRFSCAERQTPCFRYAMSPAKLLRRTQFNCSPACLPPHREALPTCTRVRCARGWLACASPGHRTVCLTRSRGLHLSMSCGPRKSTRQRKQWPWLQQCLWCLNAISLSRGAWLLLCCPAWMKKSHACSCHACCLTQIRCTS